MPVAITATPSCPSDHYVSVEGAKGLRCRMCPIGMFCKRGESLRNATLWNGYWRHDVDATEARRCPSYERDIDKWHDPICGGANGRCRKGHTGPFCTVCSPGYGRSLSHRCEPCSTQEWKDWMYISIAVFVVVCASVVVIREKMKAIASEEHRCRRRASIVEREQAITGFTSKVKIVINCAYAIVCLPPASTLALT